MDIIKGTKRTRTDHIIKGTKRTLILSKKPTNHKLIIKEPSEPGCIEYRVVLAPHLRFF